MEVVTLNENIDFDEAASASVDADAKCNRAVSGTSRDAIADPCEAVSGASVDEIVDPAEAIARTENLIGADAVIKLRHARVAVFGIGGVGSYAVEALARSQVGAIDLFDKDVVSISNINRQLIADYTTVGRDKVEVARERILQINPNCEVTAHKIFYLPETAGSIDLSLYDYIIDAVDTVTAKLCLIDHAYMAHVPVISAMGTGDKLDATAFKVGDISKTSGDGLARVMRKECKARGIKKLKCVYSEELPSSLRLARGGMAEVTDSDNREHTDPGSCESNIGRNSAELADSADHDPGRRHTPGSVAFVPSVAGLIIAGEVVKDLIS